MKKVLLLRFGELFLKGHNRKIFERKLIDNMKKKLVGEQFSFHITIGRYIIADYAPEREKDIISKLQQVFGLYNLSPAFEVEATQEAIGALVRTIEIGESPFRVSVKRADKSFPVASTEYSAILGEYILDHNRKATVDLYHPKVEVNVDIRLNQKAYIYYENIPCQGGLPLGTAGKALLLLSGGIDSPVAGYLMAKRGLEIEALHFHSYPYTSELAKEKVLTLAKQLTGYCGTIRLHIVSFTKIQEEIHKHCVPEYMITIMRRIMMRIAEQISEEAGLGALVTGESLGQVASQTMQSMTVTGNVVKKLPVFRPCIAMDKEDIMKIAREIGTYETSILPYEDCCTVFLPKFPVIKPTLKKAEHEETFLNIPDLIAEAIESHEIIEINVPAKS